jgi:hypothetical protein
VKTLLGVFREWDFFGEHLNPIWTGAAVRSWLKHCVGRVIYRWI